MANNEPDHEAAAAALGRLAGEMTALGCEAHLSTPEGRRPSLTVRHPAAPMLTKYVVADAEWFWWSWADRIAPVTDISAAARSVVRALATGGEVRNEKPRRAADPHFRVSAVLDRGRFSGCSRWRTRSPTGAAAWLPRVRIAPPRRLAGSATTTPAT
ncbi:MAG TPA: hypothetical protein VNF47_25940 [Streptosporangiaceae bacterium]|nr:hypothetical protein [Streptosporangiaceae bacterium]